MKKSISIVLLGIAVAAIAHASTLTWKTTTLDLGKVKANEVQELSFEFTNTGSEPIRILEAKGSCGCTAISYEEDEIKPGQKARISANFKSAKPGVFKKSVKVKTTASEEFEYLYFTGEVVE